jgi:Flp pilus assembly protein TadG
VPSLAPRIKRLIRSSERGTSSLELALIVPGFLLLLIGAIDLGWLVVLNNMTSEAAREGARAGKVIVSPVSSNVPVAVPSAAATPIAAAARDQVVSYGSQAYNVTATTGGSGTEGFYVQVVVTTTYQPVASTFLPISSQTVGASSRLYLP